VKTMDLIIDNIDIRIKELEEKLEEYNILIIKIKKELNILKIYKGNQGLMTGKSKLTQREYEVLIELQKGKSNAEISKSLFISHNTVKKHIYNIMSKTNAKRRTQLVFDENEFL
jgi:DNA-binding CsgD family transcriptional regulator